MKTFIVSERTSGKTETFQATTKEGAISIAKFNHGFPIFGFFTVIEL